MPIIWVRTSNPWVIKVSLFNFLLFTFLSSLYISIQNQSVSFASEHPELVNVKDLSISTSKSSFIFFFFLIPFSLSQKLKQPKKTWQVSHHDQLNFRLFNYTFEQFSHRRFEYSLAFLALLGSFRRDRSFKENKQRKLRLKL